MLDEILERLRTMPDDAKAELIEEVNNSSVGDKKWTSSPGPQTEAYLSKADLLYIGGAGGGGKAHTITTLQAYNQHDNLSSSLTYEEFVIQFGSYIYTPFGKKLIEDIKIGDQVSCPDGTISKVINKSNIQNRSCYRLVFSDGAIVNVSDDHLWAVKQSGKRTRRKIPDQYPLDNLTPTQRFNNEILKRYKIMKTTSLLNLFECAKKQKNEGNTPYWPSIPTTNAVTFTRSKGMLTLIPPYTLGVLLGDGSLTGSTPSWSKPDLIIGDYIMDELAEHDIGDDVHLLDNKYGVHSLVGGNIKAGLVSCKLDGTISNNKFIPEYYKHSSIESRLAVVNGLMDTDGHVDKRGHCSYSSASEELALDLQYILRSLGYSVTKTIKEEPAYTYKGEKKIGQPAHILYVTGRDRHKLFRLPRKQEKITELNNEGSRRLVSWEALGNMQCQCITIDHPMHLYLTNDFVVTHNSDLGLGLAINEHQRSLIMRRKYTDLAGLTDRAIEINGTRDGFNGSPPPKLITTDGRLIEFGAALRVGDEESWQGRPHDLIYIDEAVHFAESQVRFLMGWVRSTVEGQRCRVVFGSNPPLSDEGAWIIKMFAAWLDSTHPNPAKSGELRWYITDGGIDYEVADCGEWVIENGYARRATLSEENDEYVNTLSSLSRTFIPSKLKHNPYLMRDRQYKAQQDALPPHLRDAIRDGNFNAAREDHQLQLIPSAWISAAVERWRPEPHNKAPQCAIGVDIAQGGKDQTILAPRYDGWYDKLIKYPGKSTPDGRTVAGIIITHRRDQSVIVLDMGGGYGGATYEKLIENINQELVVKHKGAEKSTRKTVNGGLKFYNKRTEVYYRFFEALDPEQPGGSKIALPPDPVLFTQLCSIRLKQDDDIVIQLEPKVKLIERVGLSPDEADAVVQAWSAGPKQDNFRGGWSGRHNDRSQRPVRKAPRGASRFDNVNKKW